MGWVIKNNERFYLHEGETLLDGLVRTNQAVDFECRQGYCGTCKLRIIVKRGSFEHILPPLYHLDDNEVLACCCILSGVIEIIDE